MKKPLSFRRLGALVATAGLVLAGAATAYADVIQNDVAAANKTINLVSGGATGTTTLSIQANGQDSCNFANGGALVLNVISSNPAAATVSPSQVTFTSCSDTRPVTVTPLAQGSSTVEVSIASDSTTNNNGWNTNPAKFTVNVTAPVVTNTPPVVTLPDDIIAEATGPNGAVVTYTATADDEEQGALIPDCSPASGSTFPLGSNTVNCSVTDDGGLSDTDFFTVTVVDTTAPTLTLPDDITEEATGPDGAAVTFSATASDLVDGNVPVLCLPASGSTFPITTTTVECSAVDSRGNTADGSFTVTVEDTTAPVLSVPANMTVDAASVQGAVVTFTTSATDLVDGEVATSCTPPSGSTFAAGTTTTVTCSATDKAGNVGEATFSVTVRNYISGFYRPIDMGMVNTVKGGSTVPLKFEVFGSTEITDVAVVKSFSIKTIACAELAAQAQDAVEETSSGITNLRYDFTDGQFIQNWKTPRVSTETCYVVTMTTQDGAKISANFKLK